MRSAMNYRSKFVSIVVGAGLSILCCAADKGKNVRIPFLWSADDIDSQTTEIVVSECNFSVRAIMASGDAIANADLGTAGPVVTNMRCRIMGKAKTQWYAIDYMVLAEGAPVADNIGTWVEAGVRLTGSPDLAAPKGTDFRTVSFTQVKDKDEAFCAKHKADRMSAHSGTIEIAGRFHRAYVVCINRGRESWKLIAVFPLAPGIKEEDAKRETEADSATAGMFFGSFKIGKAKESGETSKLESNAQYIKSLLDKRGWRYLVDKQDDWTVYISAVGSSSGVYEGYRFMLFVGEDVVQNFAFYPKPAGKRRAQAIAFITMANSNYNLEYGAFKIDGEEGDVRYHLSLPISALRADKSLFSLLVSVPIRTLDKYAKGYSEVISGAKTPAAAIEEVK